MKNSFTTATKAFMPMNARIRIVIATVFVMFSVNVSATDKASNTDKVMVVTTDTIPGKTCTVVYHFPAVIYQEFASYSLKGDPMEKAAVAGIDAIAKVAQRFKANAVLSVRIEFANRTQKDEGRVLVYGTFAECK